MSVKNTSTVQNEDGVEHGLAFLESVGDDDLLKFLRRLPMVASNVEGRLTLTDLIYEMKLWPFVKEAWAEVEAGTGIAGRIIQISRVYKLAAERMCRLTGEQRRVDRMIDIPTLLQGFAADGAISGLHLENT